MPTLSFELMPTTVEEHKPTQEGDCLVLCNAEGPVFVKKGTTRLVRTGVKLRVPSKSLALVGHRMKHGNGYTVQAPTVYTSSLKLDDSGKPVEGSDGEGLTAEISVWVVAPNHSDLNVRFGEPFAVAYLVKPEELTPKSEPKKTKKVD